ncbi:antitoxin VbhA family protein [Ruegeria arenilitoris]|uniref:antitoxin VbhA family protein n=1 Tax=Ruegeria arenilitoris TaxID=1173585 RepID=UPI00147F9763|nr:antitoxin VbhA family protein [Ruegeria arenilitoris]
MATTNEALIELGKSFADFILETPLDTQGQEKRREAWRQANASVRLSGVKISDEFLAVQERHITGEISDKDVKQWIENLLTSNETL